MYLFAMIAAVQQDGLTLDTIIRDLPHDGPALVIYAMLAICGILIWKGSRRGSA
jgi:hypothetical protein